MVWICTPPIASSHIYIETLLLEKVIDSYRDAPFLLVISYPYNTGLVHVPADPAIPTRKYFVV